MKKIIVTKKNEVEEEINSGAMTRLAGVSKNLSNATNIHMAIASIPTDRCSTTHFHTNCESAIYVLSGKGLFLHGNNLEIEEEISQGDFIFVPEGALHQPINTGDKVLELIVARNTPIEIVEEKPDLGRKDC
ncbi:MAG: hypothetical protein CL775_02590 [Chloroflexi bacterium]|nr:hypothetical protein [Chloroflexota bacterium]|tara:strand:+ start:111 stop:506 length:396 start_codon:yes stop_codon:yes gene_type:complete